jgi:hypothetical protein
MTWTMIILVVVVALVAVLLLRSRGGHRGSGTVDQRNVDRVRRDGQAKGFYNQ